MILVPLIRAQFGLFDEPRLQGAVNPQFLWELGVERGASARTRGGQELPTSAYLSRGCVRSLPGGASLAARLGVTAAARVGSSGGRLSLPKWSDGVDRAS